MQLTVDNLAKMYERERMRIAYRQERDRQLLDFYRNIDCRYFNRLKNWRNRFKETYACSQEQCPIIRERMDKHMMERHCSAKTTRTEGIVRPTTSSGCIGTGLWSMVSRTHSGHRMATKTGPSTHTLLPPIGTYQDNYTSNYPNTDYFSDKTVSHSGTSVKVLNTNIEDTLKTQLKDELVNIFEDIPLNQENKEAMLTSLADDISKIIVSDNLDTDNKIKAKIDKAVNKLLKNYPASKFGKFKLVGDVRLRLFDVVKDKQQDIIKKGDRNVDSISAYSNVSDMHEENGFPKAIYDTGASRLKYFRDPIKKLFKNYPIHTETMLSEEHKDNLLNNLIDDINQMARNTTMSDADKKAEIEKILDDLYLKYPEPKDGQEKYKNEIRDKLFDLIKVGPRDLTDPIKKLFENYPIHTGTKLSKEAKDNLLNRLTDDINQIARSKTTADADKKAVIEKLLDDLHAKYPEPISDEEKQKYKNEIRDKLFDLIKPKHKGSKKKWEVPTKNDFDFSGPSDTGRRVGVGNNSGKKGNTKNSRFVTGSKSFRGGAISNSFGGPNTKTDGVSTGSSGGMNSKMIGNTTTNRLYGGGTNKGNLVGSNETGRVNHGANSTETIGNGISPNDGVFGGYSGALDNRPLTISDRNDNPTPNNNLSQEVTQFFEHHPIFNQSPQNKVKKENIIRHLVEDVNKLATNNKLNENDVADEVDKLVEKLHIRYPAHKSVQAKYKNEIRDKLCDMINNAWDNNIRNRTNGRKDRNNEAGPSKKRPCDPEYDFKQSLNKALENIAIYPQNKDEHRDSVINNLFDDISWIADSVQPDDYTEINREIERALDRLHLWYPGAKRDQVEYRNDIKDRLINVIKEYYNKNKPVRPMSSRKDDESTISESSYESDSYNTSKDRKTIKHWVNQLKHEKFMTGIDTNELVKKLNKRIVPILKLNNCCGKITILKGAVLEMLNEIPATANCNNKLQRMVNDFVNNLHCRHKNDCCSSAGSRHNTLYVDTFKIGWKSNKLKKLNEFLDENNIAQDHYVRNEIADLIIAVDEEPVDSSVECDLENEIKKILENKTVNVSTNKVINTYKNKTKGLDNDEDDGDGDDGTYINCSLTKNVLIFTSETTCCATSSPNKTANKERQKLSDEEMKYIDDLSNFIRAWMETLPVQFNKPEEKSFKDAVIAELAGEIMDFAKNAQLIQYTKEDKDNYHKRLVYKWLYKLNVFDKNKMAPQVDEFLNRLKDIPVPVLTRPQQGTRQVMDNIKVREEQGWEKDFLPKGIDVLEDEISIWVNEQPTDMFKFSRQSRNNKINNLAEAIEAKLKNKSSESELDHNIEQWLNDNVRRDKYVNIKEVKNSLKDRIIKLPGDATIAANYDEKQRERAAIKELIEKEENKPKKVRVDEDTIDIERTMKDYIVKFIDHHYDVYDPLAIRAFNYLLKRQLQRINPSTEIKGCCLGPCPYEGALSPQKLYEELELVKTVSDWLKNIPIEEGYHTVGNRERIDLVLDLTRTIKVLEDEREEAPYVIEYDEFFATTIRSYFSVIPIIEGYGTGQNYEIMIKQLMHRVDVWREFIAKKRIEKSLDTSGINDENIGDFIEEFIRHHGTEIANDEVKMEAWSIRLLREVKIIVQNAPDPKILTKTQVYNKLTSVPIPGDDTVLRFDRELVYIEEITEWMKNLPLLPIDRENEDEIEEEEENRRIMICDLAETIAQKENLAEDAKFKVYLTKWIQDLPLDKQREVNIPFLINQLIHRIERSMKDDNVVGATDSKTVVPKTSSRFNNHLKNPSKQGKISGKIATDAIEKWSNSLPVKLDEAAKDCIERKLYQKVGEFNSDPLVFHDDLLYQTLLTVEVDEILEKLPGGDKLQKTTEKQNKELVKSLVDARKMAKEKGAGDDYKHRLERTINASIPSPVTTKQVFDPAFEIYKSRLADMFILDNFDHSNDEVKMKYERRIKDEIDKYFESAEKRNATRLTKHEIYNELYSALFKVPIPNEISVMEEVEQIKTRCVIDAWIEGLPVIHKNNFFEQLEFDKKVETLAKRIHEIEKSPKSDEKLTKKISKWLTDLPLKPGEEDNIKKYTDDLKKQLKASTYQRKCFSEKDVKNKRGKVKAKSKQKQTKHDESQIPGPSTLDVSLQPSTRSQRKKAADLIVDIVEQWSNTIPISSHGKVDAETIRNDVVRKTMIKISDINTNPDIFNNDYIYKDILDKQLDKILSEIPKCCDFDSNSKAQMKTKLIESVTELKPLIREEKVRFNYIHDLNSTVDRMLVRPDNLPSNKISEFEVLQEGIVENFVQMHFDKYDDEGRQEYKANVHDAVVKFLNDVVGEKHHNPQMRMNQLLCELAKVPVPDNEVLKDEVEEIRMKNEISEFFDVNSVEKLKDKSIDVIKTILARKLVNIEKGGHNRENDDKMKNEITRTLKKLNKELKPRTIEGFVNKLKANESIRKREVTKDDTVCEKSCRMLNFWSEVEPIYLREQNCCDDTYPHTHIFKKPRYTCDDTSCPNQTKNGILKDDTARNDDTCSSTCSNKVRTQQIDTCNDTTCPSKEIQTKTNEDYGSNDDLDSDENADLLAQRLDEEEEEDEEEEVCPCERKMREMWRYYKAAARWRCGGADDPYCTDPGFISNAYESRKEMGLMKATLRR